jgi:hydroxyacylglutathione hydrolase
MLEIITLKVGQYKTNCYLVYDTKVLEAVIIDPGDDADYIGRKIFDNKLKPVAIVATHAHFDHILAVYELQMVHKIPFLMHKKDKFLLSRMGASSKFFTGVSVELFPNIDCYLVDNQLLEIGKYKIRVVTTPGHTPGSVTLYCKKEKIAFVGDLVFEGGGVGRTDFSYSNGGDLKRSVKKILNFAADTKLYCGHGQSTTVNKILNNLK